LETDTEYLFGESHKAQVLSKTILSKVCARCMSTWNHWPGYWVCVISRQPVQWSPSMALAAETSIGIRSPLKRNDPSATEAEAVQAFLSSGTSLLGGGGSGLGEPIGNRPWPTKPHSPGSTWNFT
jgi:hypothetical protein